LPPDTTSVNRTHELTLDDFTPEARAMSCEDIAADWQKTNDAMETATGAINANRTRNQVAGYIAAVGGAVGSLALFATDSNSAEKDQITKLYERHDMLIRLAALKHCPQLSS